MKKYLFMIIVLFLVACSNEKVEPEEATALNATSVLFEPSKEQENTSQESTSNEESNVEGAYYVDEFSSQIVPNGDSDPEVVLLTFDDAPDGYALDIARTLKEYQAPAIFFVNGMYLEDEAGKEALKEIYDMGFEIGNHTQTHASLDTLDREQTEYEMKETNRLVEEIIGKKPRFFRAPFGINTEDSFDIAEEENMILMNWTYGYDWEPEYQEKDALADIMVNTELLSNGANLLMHDREWTDAALPEIIEGLQAKGFNFVDPKDIR